MNHFIATKQRQWLHVMASNKACLITCCEQEFPFSICRVRTKELFYFLLLTPSVRARLQCSWIGNQCHEMICKAQPSESLSCLSAPAHHWCPYPFCFETSPLESLLSNKRSLIFMCVTQDGYIRKEKNLGLAVITQIRYYVYLKLWAIEELGTIQAMGRFGLDAGERLLQAWP